MVGSGVQKRGPEGLERGLSGLKNGSGIRNEGLGFETRVGDSKYVAGVENGPWGV